MASSADTVAEALKTQLAAIVGGAGGYIYTPSAVRRVVFWPDESALDPTLDTIYLIRSGRKVTSRYDAYRLERRQEFRILCCHRFTEPSEHPTAANPDADPVREQIGQDMEADVVRAIWADVRLGQPSVVIDAMCESWQTDPDWWTSSWVVIEIRIVVRYQHAQDDR